MKRCGPKSSACPSKPRESKLFGGVSQDFWRDGPELPDKPEKRKVSVQVLVPSITHELMFLEFVRRSQLQLSWLRWAKSRDPNRESLAI